MKKEPYINKQFISEGFIRIIARDDFIFVLQVYASIIS